MVHSTYGFEIHEHFKKSKKSQKDVSRLISIHKIRIWKPFLKNMTSSHFFRWKFQGSVASALVDRTRLLGTVQNLPGTQAGCWGILPSKKVTSPLFQRPKKVLSRTFSTSKKVLAPIFETPPLPKTFPLLNSPKYTDSMWLVRVYSHSLQWNWLLGLWTVRKKRFPSKPN